MFRQIDVLIHSANITETGVAIDMTVTYYPKLLPDFCKIEIRLSTSTWAAKAFLMWLTL